MGVQELPAGVQVLLLLKVLGKILQHLQCSGSCELACQVLLQA